MIYIKPIKAWIVHAHMKITATFEQIFIMTVLISGPNLKAIPPTVSQATVWGTVPPDRPLSFVLLLSPCQCDWTFNDLTGPFNWVENVQVCRAQLHLSQETKSLALYSQTVERDAVDSHTGLRGGWKHTKHVWPQSFSHTLAQILYN